MGASIYWRPTNRGRNLSVGAWSSFLDALRKAFGELPVKLSEKDLPTLRGMAAVDGEFGRLVALIEENGEIEIYAEW